MKKSLILGIIIVIVVIGISAILALSTGSLNTQQNIVPDTPQNITINLREGLTMNAP
ncbi:MAG: hypothetical protein ACE5RF_09015 [Nitrosarchaeum sp.]